MYVSSKSLKLSSLHAHSARYTSGAYFEDRNVPRDMCQLHRHISISKDQFKGLCSVGHKGLISFQVVEPMVPV
jgi:hypothetical protein